MRARNQWRRSPAPSRGAARCELGVPHDVAPRRRADGRDAAARSVGAGDHGHEVGLVLGVGHGAVGPLQAPDGDRVLGQRLPPRPLRGRPRHPGEPRLGRPRAASSMRADRRPCGRRGTPVAAASMAAWTASSSGGPRPPPRRRRPAPSRRCPAGRAVTSALGQVAGPDLDPHRHALELPVGGPATERDIGAGRRARRRDAGGDQLVGERGRGVDLRRRSSRTTSTTTWVAASRGGTRSPSSSPWAMISPPIIRVDTPHDVVQPAAAVPSASR